MIPAGLAHCSRSATFIWRFTTRWPAQEAFEAARQIALRVHLYFGIVESTFHLARLAHSQGQLRRAAAICREGQADIAALLAHPEQDLPAVGCLDIALGCVLLEQDQLAEAEQHLLRGLELIGVGHKPLLPVYGLHRAISPVRDPGPFGRGAGVSGSPGRDMAGCRFLHAAVCGSSRPCDPRRRIQPHGRKQWPGVRISRLPWVRKFCRPAWVRLGRLRFTTCPTWPGSRPDCDRQRTGDALLPRTAT